MVPSIIITRWSVIWYQLQIKIPRKTLGPGSKNYYPGANFYGKEASKYGIILNFYYLVGKFGISYKLKLQGKY